MERKKIVGIALLVVGIIVLVLSVLADLIGIGGGGFGPKQIVGVVAGAISVILGLILTLNLKK